MEAVQGGRFIPQGEFVLMNSAFKYIGLYSIQMVTEVPCENILKYNQLAETAATGQEKSMTYK